MKTDEFNSVVTDRAINKCLEYSDNPDKLKSLMEDLKVSVKFTGTRKYFADDKEERLTGKFKLERNGQEISFNFGFSINDTEIFSKDNYNYKRKIYDTTLGAMSEKNKDKKEFMFGLLYNCLTTCRSEYYIPIDFDEFCSEFGYDNDSIKAKSTWEACLKQSAKLQRIFNDKDIDCLPA